MIQKDFARYSFSKKTLPAIPSVCLTGNIAAILFLSSEPHQAFLGRIAQKPALCGAKDAKSKPSVQHVEGTRPAPVDLPKITVCWRTMTDRRNEHATPHRFILSTILPVYTPQRGTLPPSTKGRKFSLETLQIIFNPFGINSC